jgi:hypothetical protein
VYYRIGHRVVFDVCVSIFGFNQIYTVYIICSWKLLFSAPDKQTSQSSGFRTSIFFQKYVLTRPGSLTRRDIPKKACAFMSFCSVGLRWKLPVVLTRRYPKVFITSSTSQGGCLCCWSWEISRWLIIIHVGARNTCSFASSTTSRERLLHMPLELGATPLRSAIRSGPGSLRGQYFKSWSWPLLLVLIQMFRLDKNPGYITSRLSPACSRPYHVFA